MSAILKVLHIEDDSTDALLMRELMRTGEAVTPMEVSHVDNLKDGLNTLATADYDAILLDLNLPDLSGPDNVRMLSEQAPEVPIIVLSGDANNNSVSHAIENGAQDYMVKGHCDGTAISMAIRSSIQRKTQERRLYMKANFDDLTGLPNKNLLLSEMKKKLLVTERRQKELSIIYFGVDSMRQINKKFGIETGNNILQEISLRAKQILGEKDYLGRYRGDEFLIFGESNPEKAHDYAQEIATRLNAKMAQPFKFGDSDYHFTVSSGIVTTHYTKNRRTLIHQAISAMLEAKEIGNGQFCIYEPSIMAA